MCRISTVSNAEIMGGRPPTPPPLFGLLSGRGDPENEHGRVNHKRGIAAVGTDDTVATLSSPVAYHNLQEYIMVARTRNRVKWAGIGRKRDDAGSRRV